MPMEESARIPQVPVKRLGNRPGRFGPSSRSRPELEMFADLHCDPGTRDLLVGLSAEQTDDRLLGQRRAALDQTSHSFGLAACARQFGRIESRPDRQSALARVDGIERKGRPCAPEAVLLHRKPRVLFAEPVCPAPSNCRPTPALRVSNLSSE